MAKKAAKAALVVAVLFGAGPLFVPEALAFAHREELHGQTVYSVDPIDTEMLAPVIARANALARTSPLSRHVEHRRIFLTDGGWRWHWLSIGGGGSFALTRMVGNAVVVNASDVRTDWIDSDRAVGNDRSLSGTLAHEITHGVLRREIGMLTTAIAPQWLVEGYADYIARESSLSDADYADLKTHGIDHPAIPYYEGRRRVAAALAENGGSVRKLFEGNN